MVLSNGTATEHHEGLWSCLSYHRPSVGSCGGREGLGVAGITGTPIMGGGGEGEGEGGDWVRPHTSCPPELSAGLQ